MRNRELFLSAAVGIFGIPHLAYAQEKPLTAEELREKTLACYTSQQYETCIKEVQALAPNWFTTVIRDKIYDTATVVLLTWTTSDSDDRGSIAFRCDEKYFVAIISPKQPFQAANGRVILRIDNAEPFEEDWVVSKKGDMLMAKGEILYRKLIPASTMIVRTFTEDRSVTMEFDVSSLGPDSYYLKTECPQFSP